MDFDFFRLTNPLDALNAKVAPLLTEGLSMRALARQCGLASPNALTRILRGDRSLTLSTGKKIADGLNFSSSEKQYFLQLIHLHLAKSTEKQNEALNALLKIVGDQSKTSVSDHNVFSHWLYPILYELSYVKGLKFTAENLLPLLNFHCLKEELGQAITYMERQGWIELDQEQMARPKNFAFTVFDDVKHLFLYKNHIRYLEIAKQRAHDRQEDREFRGYTVAIPESKFSELREVCRAFFRHLHQVTADYQNTDQVVHVELGLFKLTKLASRLESLTIKTEDSRLK